MKRVLTWVSGPLLAIALLAFFVLSGEDYTLADLLEGLRTASLPLLGLCLLSGIVHLLLRAWRWGTLLDPVRPRDELPYMERVSATAIGNMALVLPGRVGEVVRPALLSRRVGLPFGTTLSTIGVERILLDLLGVLLFGAVGLILPPRLSGVGAAANPDTLALVRSSGIVLLGGGAAALATVAVVARRRGRVARWLSERSTGAGNRVVAAVLRWVASLLPGLAAFASPRGLARLAAETLLIWGIIAAGLHAGIVACGVELAPLSMLVLLPILAIGIGVPTPGGTGSYHVAMLIGVHELLGAPEAVAKTAGILVHLVILIQMLGVGAVFVARGGLERGPRPGDAERATGSGP